MDKEELMSLDQEKLTYLKNMNSELQEYIFAVNFEVAAAHMRSLTKVLKLTDIQKDELERYMDFEGAVITDNIIRHYADNSQTP